MSENKTSKYFKYAIGEIILVVIGILIALQINNWNESKNTKTKEHQILTEVISDLDYSITDLDEKLNFIKRNINSINILITTLQTTNTYNDSLGIHFSNSNSFEITDFKSSGYQSLSSIGMDLVENQKIRSSIGELYTTTIPDYKQSYIEIEKDFYSYMLDYMRNDFTLYLNYDGDRALHPNNYEALRSNKVYIQSLRLFLDVKNYYIKKGTIAKDKAEELKKDIENYIRE